MPLIVNMASSLDGKINPAVRRGPFTMSRHPTDYARMLALRATADAVLIGAGNLRADNPDLTIPPQDFSRRGSFPLRVLVTRRGEGISGTEAIFNPRLGGPTIVAHAETMHESARLRLAHKAELVAMGDSEVDVARLLTYLERRGARVVVCEGGGILNAQLFAARLVDELHITLVPRILGAARAPTVVAGAGFGEDEIPDAKLAQSEVVGDELFLRYQFTWPERSR